MKHCFDANKPAGLFAINLPTVSDLAFCDLECLEYCLKFLAIKGM